MSLNIHNKKGFKYFTFSNLFPPPHQKLIQNKVYSLIVSSPNKKIIDLILYNSPIGEIINFGEYSFSLDKLEILKGFRLDDFTSYRTATFINITKRTEKGYKSLIYGRDIEFMDLLTKNSLSKFNNYYRENNTAPIFENCVIEPYGKKSVNMRIHNKNGDFDLIGNILRFSFGKLQRKQREILEFLLDCGFGERTSYGLGLLSKLKDQDVKQIEIFDRLIGGK
jgi:CRISPR-associated endoribonuclease Cas6